MLSRPVQGLTPGQSIDVTIHMSICAHSQLQHRTRCTVSYIGGPLVDITSSCRYLCWSMVGRSNRSGCMCDAFPSLPYCYHYSGLPHVSLHVLQATCHINKPGTTTRCKWAMVQDDEGCVQPIASRKVYVEDSSAGQHVSATASNFGSHLLVCRRATPTANPNVLCRPPRDNQVVIDRCRGNTGQIRHHLGLP
jgi:hypothetical protein